MTRPGVWIKGAWMKVVGYDGSVRYVFLGKQK